MSLPEALAPLAVALKENAPGTVLPPHKRYALSVIADGQSARGTADGFTKAASNGVSPEAHAADNAAEQMSAKIGIAPPPEPMALPQDPNAASSGQQAYSASNPDPASGATPVGGSVAPGQPGTAMVNAGPPPGTYYDPVRKISVYDPNYHGPYTTIMSPTDVSPGAEPLASGPSAPASGATAVSGQGAGSSLGPRPADPVYGTAPVDQGRIDHAWKVFDEAMARMPVPPKPADMPKIGMEQLFIAAAAGLIDPVAGSIVAKSILEAPVFAKQYMDTQRDKDYGRSISLWQNETQRTMQSATNVERSEESSRKTEQARLDKVGDAGTTILNKWTSQAGANERNIRGKLTERAKNLETILTSKPLDAATRKQYTDTLNAVNAQLSSGAPLLDTNGEPTEQFKKMEQDIATAEATQHDKEAHSRYLGARFDLTEGQLDRLNFLMPHEADKMDSQTALNYGHRLVAVQSAINLASQVDKRTFDEGLAIGRFNLDATKAQLGEVGKMLTEKIKERDGLNKAADKLEKDADKFHTANLAAIETRKDAKIIQQWQDMLDDAKKKREAAAKMDDPNAPDGGAIPKLQATHERVSALLSQAGQGLPQVPATPTADSVGAGKADAFASAIEHMEGKPYEWGGGHGDSGEKSVDCSGAVCVARRQAGYKDDWGDKTAAEMAKATQPVTQDPRRGDLVFFDRQGDGKIEHVGVYLGAGWIMEASSGKGHVVRTKLTEQRLKTIVQIGRMLDEGSVTPGTQRKSYTKPKVANELGGPMRPG